MRGRRGVRLAVGVLLAVALFAIVLNGRSLALSLITGLVRVEYPALRWESGAELARGGVPKPLLLDVREQAEFAVSHLAGARRLEPGASIPPDVLALPRDTPIVTYCAVGRRSAAVASALQAAGFTQVRNLDGAIFRWVNEGRPLVRDTAAATRVHPYSRFWGLLLQPERRATE